jgi:hypothetical protein
VPQINPLGKEAEAFAISELQLRVDGESTFVVCGWRDREVRNAKLDVTSSPLEEADRLNNIEWKGIASLSGKVSRRREHDDKRQREWSEWSEYKDDIWFGLEKANGKWRSRWP